MRRLLLLLWLLLLPVMAAQAQYVKVLGVAGRSTSVVTSGIPSTNKAFVTYPLATIDIYATGTTTHLPIFSSSTGTVKANPFSATTPDAYYDFFVASGTAFDVRISGVSGGVTITPFTRSGYVAPGTSGVTLLQCGGSNDTTLLSAASALGGTIEIPNGITCASDSLTISTALQVDKGGLLQPLSGQTLTLTGPQIGGTQQRFDASLGTISFTGNTLLPVVYPTWWATNTTPGTTDMGTAITASVTAARTANATILFPSGTYAYAVCPNFGFSNITVRGEGYVLLKHTGTGEILKIKEASAARIDNLHITGLVLQGNASSDAAGVLIESVQRSVIQLRGIGAPGAMFTVKWGVVTTYDLVASSNEQVFSPTPTSGVVVTSNSGGQTTGCVFNLVIEGIHGKGVDVQSGSNNVFNGTSESNFQGVKDNALDLYNTYNLYLDGNVHAANITAGSNASPVSLTSVAHGLSTGDRITISGGTLNWLPLNARWTVTVTGVDTFTIPVDSSAFGAVTGSLVFESGADFLGYGGGTRFNNVFAKSQGPNVDMVTAQDTVIAGGLLRAITLGSTAITAATNASPVQLTATGHPLYNGQRVYISGATDNWTPINGLFIATVTGFNTFTIAQLDGTPVDSTTFGALTGSPTVGSTNTTMVGMQTSDNAQLGITGTGSQRRVGCSKVDSNGAITSVYSDTLLMTVTKQGTPSTPTGSTTLTAANVQIRMIVATPPNAGGNVNYTLPTGSNMDSGNPPSFNNDSFDWVLINRATTGGDTITIVANTDHTIVGNPLIAINSGCTLRSRRTGTNTWVTYIFC